MSPAAEMRASDVRPGMRVECSLRPGRRAWLRVVGACGVNYSRCSSVLLTLAVPAAPGGTLSITVPDARVVRARR